jgi:hypothetical protein
MHPIPQPFTIKFVDQSRKVRAGQAIACDANGDVFKVLRTGGIDKGAIEEIDSGQIVDGNTQQPFLY